MIAENGVRTFCPAWQTKSRTFRFCFLLCVMSNAKLNPCYTLTLDLAHSASFWFDKQTVQYTSDILSLLLMDLCTNNFLISLMFRGML